MKQRISNIVGWVSAGLALWTLWQAFQIRDFKHAHPDDPAKDAFAQFLIGFWALIPPVWFLIEFRYLTTDTEMPRAKQNYELSRNIWIALVIVLAAVMEIKWPK